MVQSTDRIQFTAFIIQPILNGCCFFFLSEYKIHQSVPTVCRRSENKTGEWKPTKMNLKFHKIMINDEMVAAESGIEINTIKMELKQDWKKRTTNEAVIDRYRVNWPWTNWNIYGVRMLSYGYFNAKLQRKTIKKCNDNNKWTHNKQNKNERKTKKRQIRRKRKKKEIKCCCSFFLRCGSW